MNAAQKFFNFIISGDPAMVRHFTDDVDAVRNRATELYDGLLPDMPYVDDPAHPMANSMFFCASMLAVYMALDELLDEGVDVHAFGRQMLKVVAENSQRQPPPAPAEPAEALVASAKASQQGAADNEFVYEIVEGEPGGWAMNITSCAICSLFSKRDAMALVPYMCASDDVGSDAGGQGLKRTGSIALGAHHCDFRFKPGGEGQRLADQYPEQIRLNPAD